MTWDGPHGGAQPGGASRDLEGRGGDKPHVVARERIFTGWNSLDIVTVEARDTRGVVRRHRREVIDHGEAAAVLAVDRERRVAILVRQWRAPLVASGGDGFLLEVCAGLVDPGETPEQAARREAEEEIGFRIASIRKVASVFSSAGTLTERMHLFLADVAEAQRTESGGGNPHEGEDIEVIEVPLRALYDRAERGDIVDAKTLILVQRLMIEEMRASRPEELGAPR